MTDNAAIGLNRPIGSLRPSDPERLGDYRLIGRIGRGGMGTVYLAENAAGERAAVKVINPELSDDDSFRLRFRQEVESARRVRRFCTAPVLDARLDGDDLFIVTEFVDGLDLGEYVTAHGPMRGSSLEHLAVGVATALTAIHGAGVVHRDLKPGNVLLSSLGPRVIDFGIARALDAAGSATRTGSLIGTPAYMAPELISGAKASQASDVFAWACVVAYAGTGRAPFDAETLPAVLYQITHGEPRLDGLDEGLRGLIEQSLSKNPADRPSAQGLLDRLTGRPQADSASVARDVDRTWAAGLTRPDGEAPAASPARPAPDGQSGQSGQGGQSGFGVGPGGWTQAYGDPAQAAPVQAAPAQAVPTQWSGSPEQPWTPSNGAPTIGKQMDRRRTGLGAVLRRQSTRTVGIALGVVLVVAAGVVAAVVLTRPDGPPDNLVPLYSDTFSNTSSGWGGSTYTPNSYGYTNDVYRVDSDDLEMYGSPYKKITAGGAMVSADVKILRAPAYGQVGLFCRGSAIKKTGYLFLIRADAKGAVIRRITETGGSKDLAVSTDKRVPGFDPTEVNRLSAACEETKDGSTLKSVRLRLWADGDLIAEATDEQLPIPATADNNEGLVAVQQNGVSAGVTAVQFDNFDLSQIR